jgi:hypothetical protein
MDNPKFHQSPYAQKRKQEIADNAHVAIGTILQTPSAECEQESKGDKAMPAKVPPTFVPFTPNKEWERKNQLDAYTAFIRGQLVYIALPKIGVSMDYDTRFGFLYCDVSCKDFTWLKLPFGSEVASEWKFLEGQIFKVVVEDPDRTHYIRVTRLS